MAEQTTTQTPVGKPISSFEQLAEVQDATIIPVVDTAKNKKVTAQTLKAYAQKGVAKEADLSNVISEPSDGGKEVVESNLVTEALRKTVQKLTDAEKAQVLKNLGEPQYLLFIDQFNTAAGTNGKYDPVNAPDPQHPFYLNTIWLTYEEALKSLETFTTWGTSPMNSYCTDIRTNIPPYTSAVSSSREYQNSFERIEVVNLDRINVYRLRVCLNGSNLKKVLNFNAKYLELLNNSFNAPKLIDLQISNLKISLDLSKCPLINLASWQGLVSKAANTTEITVTVHTDVYAKLSGDTTNAAAAALTADELTAWQAVMTSAAAKNIAFATTA